MLTTEFLITSLIVVLIPGTGVIFTVSTGLARGRLASIFAALGCTLGIVPHLLATVFGLAAVMHTSALAFQALKFAGVAYLLYLAVATWRDRRAFAVQDIHQKGAAFGLVAKAVLVNILNPKLTIFFLAFLPQFVTAGDESPLAQLLALSATLMAMTFLVFVGYGFLAHSLRGGHRLAEGANLASSRVCWRICRTGRSTGPVRAMKLACALAKQTNEA